MGQKIQDWPLVWQRQPYTPESLCSVAPDQTPAYAGALSSRQRKGLGSWLLTSDEKRPAAPHYRRPTGSRRGRFPQLAQRAGTRRGRGAPFHCRPLADPFTQRLTALQLHNQKGPQTGFALPGLLKWRRPGCQSRSTGQRSSRVKAMPTSFLKPQHQLPLLYSTFSGLGTLKQ